jgi:hypothetical protein
MMKTLVLAAAMLVPVAARADDRAVKSDAKQMHTDDCAKARKQNRTCIIDMTGEKIGGNVPGGDGMTVTSPKFNPPTSLIHVRHDFIPEIIKSAEDL